MWCFSNRLHNASYEVLLVVVLACAAFAATQMHNGDSSGLMNYVPERYFGQARALLKPG